MVIEDIISTIKEKHKRDGYVPVGLKVCKKDEKSIRQFYLSQAIKWVEVQLFRYRIEEGLEVGLPEHCRPQAGV